MVKLFMRTKPGWQLTRGAFGPDGHEWYDHDAPLPDFASTLDFYIYTFTWSGKKAAFAEAQPAAQPQTAHLQGQAPSVMQAIDTVLSWYDQADPVNGDKSNTVVSTARALLQDVAIRLGTIGAEDKFLQWSRPPLDYLVDVRNFHVGKAGKGMMAGDQGEPHE